MSFYEVLFARQHCNGRRVMRTTAISTGRVGMGMRAMAPPVRAAECGGAELDGEKVETAGFERPESAFCDGDVTYVSNIGPGTVAPADTADGDGYISRLETGAAPVFKWATGFDSPKGLRVHGGRLYVADL